MLKDASAFLSDVFGQASVEERTDIGLIKERVRVELQRASAALGAPAARAAGRHGDLDTWPDRPCLAHERSAGGGAVCRVPALADLARQPQPGRPGVVLQHGHRGAGQLRGPARCLPRGAVLPAVRLRVVRRPRGPGGGGLALFWCRALDARLHEGAWRGPARREPVSFLALAFETLDFGGRADRAGGVVARCWPGSWPST